MQTLEKRNTYTPPNASQVRCNCDPALNREETLSVPCLKTSLNISDAALTATGHAGQDLRVPAVFVQNIRGQALMPTTPRTARVLLRYGKAKVIKRTPFTIRLCHTNGESKQEIMLGVDSGFCNVGISAVTKNKEVYSADVHLRNDIVKLNSERRQYRRARRHRKTRYRQPRFLNRKKPEGWLAPSIQHKLDSHLKIVRGVLQILPISAIVVEVAAFDIQKIRNPEISGELYQQGEQFGFCNVREYVLHRDGHTCQHCKGKNKDHVLEVHHIISRQTGGDRPDNLLTLCKTCHDGVSQGKIDLGVTEQRGFKAETFMSVVRWRLVNQLKELYPRIQIQHTYGHFTKTKRVEFGLPKSHTNDAFVIAGGERQERSLVCHIQRQVRKCNRKLFRGDRSHIRNTAPREVFGFRLWDKVDFGGRTMFIKGRRVTGYFALSDIDGKNAKETSYKKLSLIEARRNILTDVKVAIPPPIKIGGLLATSL